MLRIVAQQRSTFEKQPSLFVHEGSTNYMERRAQCVQFNSWLANWLTKDTLLRIAIC